MSHAQFRICIISILSSLVLLGGCGGPIEEQEPASYSTHYSNTPAEPLSLIAKDENRISAGRRHYLAIDNNGGVFSWGGNNHLCTVPEGLSDVVMVSASASHNLALKSDGSIVAWGDAANLPEGLSDNDGFVAVAAGYKQSLGLKANGTVIGWGKDMEVPEGLHDVVEINAKRKHFSALKSDGSIVSWGEQTPRSCWGEEGPCHFDLSTTTYFPDFEVASTSISHFKDVLALSNSGEMYRFGMPNDTFPEKIELEGMSQTISASSHGSYYLALGANGEVYSWNKGYQWNGELGPFEEGQDFISGIKAVNARSGIESLALTEDGKVFTWQPNTTFHSYPDMPENMRRSFNIQLISPSIWLKSNGTLQTNISPEKEIEAQLSEIKNIIAIPSIGGLGFAITGEGDVHLLLDQFSSIDFNGGTNKIFSNSKIIDVAPSWNGNLALNNDGSVFMFNITEEGNSENYIHPSQPELPKITAIASGSSHYLALDDSGKVHAWGTNKDGQTNVPMDLSNVIAISAGYSHSTALRNDGTVVTWGSFYLKSENSGESLKVSAVTPDGVKDVVKLSSSSGHVLALNNDGTVVAWGGDLYGETNVPKGLKNVTAISSDGYSSNALRSDGTVVTWGNNNYTIGMHDNWASSEFIDSIRVTP